MERSLQSYFSIFPKICLQTRPVCFFNIPYLREFYEPVTRSMITQDRILLKSYEENRCYRDQLVRIFFPILCIFFQKFVLCFRVDCKYIGTFYFLQNMHCKGVLYCLKFFKILFYILPWTKYANSCLVLDLTLLKWNMWTRKYIISMIKPN